MQLGKVIGNVVSTRKEGNLHGYLIVSHLDENFLDTNKTEACIDTVSAGSGDIVLLCSSSSARITKTTKYSAIDKSIVGIVDSVSSGNDYLYSKSKRD